MTASAERQHHVVAQSVHRRRRSAEAVMNAFALKLFFTGTRIVSRRGVCSAVIRRVALETPYRQVEKGSDDERERLRRQMHRRVVVLDVRHAAGDGAGRRRDRRHHLRSIRRGASGRDGDAVQSPRQHRRQSGNRHRRARRVSIHQARAGHLHREGGSGRVPLRRSGEHRRQCRRHRARRSEAGDRHARGRHHRERGIAPARYDVGAEADGVVPRGAGQPAESHRRLGASRA